ncbi:adenylosuccinate lyase [Candidatus Anaplasma sp. TIGMIC]|uniref:adenylosuccinate lyase n=1 Tax=Candidatus Anaplasma sp. TIGMIC TaxID=3020713 RepID=UPI0023307708|nr:adenylosuccinate lyase [Candidatus Anaplasma sp. TIGMIC]MDB1135606.1 adenylosuccinate lyase [Candidatus Anaplasma sp. TIGMIC]
MIDRYSIPEMVSIWEEENKYRIWFEIEKSACEAQVKLGVVPPQILDGLQALDNSKFNTKRIAEIEAEVKHDVIAFLSYIAESTSTDIRFLHYGMTSSDVLDTCLSLQLKQSCDILLKNIEDVLLVLKERSEESKYLLCVGRSHGVHAEPITFGLKLARFYAEFSRNHSRLLNAKEEISICKISGAMGNFAHLDPFVEEYVANALGLVPETISSQVISRDRYAVFFATLGIIASSMEKVATEMRHLQQTEVLEVTEPFTPGQKGSSAMPHKQNPILGENLTGLARVIRSYVMPAMENVALWHERDISHSSVERFIAPDACVTLNFALVRLAHLLRNMCINKDRIQANLDSSKNMMLSQRVLLALIDSGISREKAYKIVQDCAMDSWKLGSDFVDNVKNHPLSKDCLTDMDALSNLGYYTKHVDFIFNKVFGN